MSKFIPPKKTAYGGQVKPKLKVKVVIQDKESILNEYDAFQMISDLNAKVVQLSQAVNGILDAMEAATAEVTQPSVSSTGPMKPTPIKLPKLNKVESKGLSSEHIYPNSSDSVTLQS